MANSQVCFAQITFTVEIVQQGWDWGEANGYLGEKLEALILGSALHLNFGS